MPPVLNSFIIRSRRVDGSSPSTCCAGNANGTQPFRHTLRMSAMYAVKDRLFALPVFLVCAYSIRYHKRPSPWRFRSSSRYFTVPVGAHVCKHQMGRYAELRALVPSNPYLSVRQWMGLAPSQQKNAPSPLPIQSFRGSSEAHDGGIAPTVKHPLPLFCAGMVRLVHDYDFRIKLQILGAALWIEPSQLAAVPKEVSGQPAAITPSWMPGIAS